MPFLSPEQGPRAVFNWVSQVIQNYFGNALLRTVIGYKKGAPSTLPVRRKTNCGLVARVFPRSEPVSLFGHSGYTSFGFYHTQLKTTP